MEHAQTCPQYGIHAGMAVRSGCGSGGRARRESGRSGDWVRTAAVTTHSRLAHLNLTQPGGVTPLKFSVVNGSGQIL